MSATRLYMGKLPPNVTRQDVEDYFKGYQLSDIRLMGHFGFLQFESEADADDALRDFAGRDFMGASVILEKPRESRRRDTYDGRGPGDDRGPPRGGLGNGLTKGVRVNIIGIPHSTSWQDLKDYGRIGSNNVMYADVDRNNPGNGIIEFGSLAEAEEAIARLSGVDINNTPVKLEIAPDDGRSFDRGPPPRDIRPRFDDRGPSRGYEDRRRYDDRRDDRGSRRDYDRGGDRDRDRDRERELRRGRDRDRERSPPRRRGEDDRYIARA